MENSFENIFVQIAQGVGTIIPPGTNIKFFIPKGNVPSGRTVTYERYVAEIQPQKSETHRTRIIVVGNKINFPSDITTTTADFTTSKLIFNSVLSTKNEKFMYADICNFYLNNTMDIYEYVVVDGWPPVRAV